MSKRAPFLFSFFLLYLFLINPSTLICQSLDLRQIIANEANECISKLDSTSSMQIINGCIKRSVRNHENEIVFKPDPESAISVFAQELQAKKKMYHDLDMILVEECESFLNFWIKFLDKNYSDIRLFSSDEKLESISLLLQGNYSSELISERGTVYMGLNKLDSAMIDFNEAIKLNSSNTQAWYFKGLLYEIQKDYSNALTSYNEILKRTTDEEAKFLVTVLKMRIYKKTK